jgi:hypothetical protein
MSFKPLSKYHFTYPTNGKKSRESQQKTRINCITHRFAFLKLFNKLFECEEREKDDKEEVEYKITGTSKESI